MRLATTLCAACAVVVLSAAICEAGIASKGTQEIMGSLLWDKYTVSDDDESASLSAFVLTPTYGYFFVDNYELQVRLEIANLRGEEKLGSHDSDYSATTWTPIVALLGHASISESYLPYLGVGFGGSWFGDSEGSETEATTIVPVILLGGKMLVTERAAINVEVHYMRELNALYTEDLEGSDFGLTVGISLFFGAEAGPETEDERWHPLGW